jgi:hypothetical protein
MTTRNIKKRSGGKSKGKKPSEYIGDFIWQFGTVQIYINEIFLTLFDLERVALRSCLSRRRTQQLLEFLVNELAKKQM